LESIPAGRRRAAGRGWWNWNTMWSADESHWGAMLIGGKPTAEQALVSLAANSECNSVCPPDGPRTGSHRKV